MQRPLGCFLSGGFLDFLPTSSNTDTGFGEERAAACEPGGLALTLLLPLSRYHIRHLTLSTASMVSGPQPSVRA